MRVQANGRFEAETILEAIDSDLPLPEPRPGETAEDFVSRVASEDLRAARLPKEEGS